MTIRTVVLAMVFGAVTACAAEEPPRTEPTATAATAPAASVDPAHEEVLRFARRASTFYPDSTFTVTGDETFSTRQGDYRIVTVDRQCASQFLTGEFQIVIDEAADEAWMGMIAELPTAQDGVPPDRIQEYLEELLPRALGDALRLNLEVRWDASPRRPTALVPFDLEVDTGYGTFPKLAAYTADGERLILGERLPFDRDPVEVRRERLAVAPEVMWGPEGPDRPVPIVEFSDFQCPSCKTKWPDVVAAMEAAPGEATHGLVNFPLTAIHPWAFRGASAAWCVWQQDPGASTGLKELFYDLQSEMELALVTDTAVDYVAGAGLDEEAFRDCYLQTESVAAVHRQMALGHELGVQATPTYFVDGWRVQVPDAEWLIPMVERIAAGEEP